jgi:hypothetical protein
MRYLASCIVIASLIVSGCQIVTVTKTGKGYAEPTKADDIQILMTKPDRAFEELATVSTNRWSPGEDAKLHNALRAKCAPLGADAVVIMSSGIDYNGYAWTNGVAIRFK